MTLFSTLNQTMNIQLNPYPRFSQTMSDGLLIQVQNVEKEYDAEEIK